MVLKYETDNNLYKKSPDVMRYNCCLNCNLRYNYCLNCNQNLDYASHILYAPSSKLAEAVPCSQPTTIVTKEPKFSFSVYKCITT